MKSIAEIFPEEKEDSVLVKEFAEQAKQIYIQARNRLTLQGKVNTGGYINVEEDASSVTRLMEFLDAPAAFPDACLCSMSLCIAVGSAMDIKGWSYAHPRTSGGPIGFVIRALDDSAADVYRENPKTLPNYYARDEADWVKNNINIAIYNDRADWNTLLYVWDRCGKENGWL